jgi:hypothetical protein
MWIALTMSLQSKWDSLPEDGLYNRRLICPTCQDKLSHSVVQAMLKAREADAALASFGNISGSKLCSEV